MRFCASANLAGFYGLAVFRAGMLIAAARTAVIISCPGES
jgi:hypothetical protein